jgi:hypothetical protein
MSTYPYNAKYAPVPVPDLHNWNTDRSGDTPVMIRGSVNKTSGGSWVYNQMATSLQISTVQMATAGVDYNSIIPADTKSVNIKVRGLNGTTVSCAVGTISASSYFTLIDSQTETIGGPGCMFDSFTLHFSPDANNTIMEITIYK